MISRNTVLVLGAGASKPYDFPIGEELVRSAIDIVSDKEKLKVLIDAEYDLDVIEEFISALKFSARSSVDAFLEHRTEFIEVGKAVIALSLIPYENEETLFKFGGGGWYRFLYNQLNTSFNEFGSNRLSIITFNYDRSFEHFLFTAIKNSYGKSDRECAEALSKIPIIHIHGNLGNLPWQESGTNIIRQYSNKIGVNNIRKVSSHIKIIHEGVLVESTELSQASKLLHTSERVYLLGFGYNSTNMRRLGIGKLPTTVSVRGTGLGLTRKEINEISNQFRQVEIAGDQDCISFMRNTALFS